MRFQDWDVLLFPQGDGIPQPEFRIQALADYDDFGNVGTILTCYMPSLPAGSPYQASVHSWKPPKHMAAIAAYGERAAWAVRVIVDGAVLASETYVNGTKWPQVIGRHRGENAESNKVLLSFPPFHRQILAQPGLRLNDAVGRIKVIIYEGFIAGDAAQFTPIKTVVTFNFVHAPDFILEKAGVAWPSQRLLEPVIAVQQAMAQQYNQFMMHQQYAGQAMAQPYGYNMNPQNFGHAMAHQNFMNQYHFAQPMMQQGYAPPIQHVATAAPQIYPQPPQQLRDSDDTVTLPDTAPGSVFGSNVMDAISAVDPKSRVEVRLPSDQIRQIVDAMSPKPATQESSRKASDISMHANCNEFPGCTTDSPDGGVVHTPTRASTVPHDSVLRSRKRSRPSFSGKEQNAEKEAGRVRKVSKTCG